MALEDLETEGQEKSIASSQINNKLQNLEKSRLRAAKQLEKEQKRVEMQRLKEEKQRMRLQKQLEKQQKLKAQHMEKRVVISKISNQVPQVTMHTDKFSKSGYSVIHTNYQDIFSSSFGHKVSNFY